MFRFKEYQDRIDDLEYEIEMIGVEEEEAAYKSDLYDCQSYRDRRQVLNNRIAVIDALSEFEIARWEDNEEWWNKPYKHCNCLHGLGTTDEQKEYNEAFCSRCPYSHVTCMYREDEFENKLVQQ